MPRFPIGEQSAIGTFIGAGVGVSIFLLLVLSISVILIFALVVVKRKTAYMQKREVSMGDNLHHSNTVVVNQEMAIKGVGADYKDADGYQGVDKDKGEEEGPTNDGLDPYEVVDRKVHTKSANKPAPKESAPTASATTASAVYAVVDKSRKKGAKKETGGGCTVTNTDEYAMPMKKMGKMADKGEGVVESSSVEDREQCDDTVGFKYEPKADSGPWKPSEGGSKC